MDKNGRLYPAQEQFAKKQAVRRSINFHKTSHHDPKTTFMKQFKLILLAVLIFAPAITRAVTVITSLPYTITTPGSYVLKSNLTASDTGGIGVNASNVSINLGGYTLEKQSPNGFVAGIAVFPGMSNVSIQNGCIVEFDEGVLFNGCSYCALKNVRIFNTINLVNNQTAVNALADNCVIENCFIVGHEGNIGISIDHSSSGAILIKNTQVYECYYGIWVDGPTGPMAVIGNYEANCQYGLTLSPGSKYQGNITTNCVVPVTGGTAVGKENG